MTDSTDSSKEKNISQHQEFHFTPHHTLSEFKSLSKKYFILILMLVMLPISIIASYQAVINQSSAKSSTAANIIPTKIPTLTPLPAISPTPAVEIIIDNSDLTGVTITGSWQALNNVSGFIGSDYLDNMGKRNGPENIKYSPVIPETGYYDVYIRWTDHKNRAWRVPVRVEHDYGTFVKYVNQQKNGGKWVKIDRFIFSPQKQGSVTISTRKTDDHVIADGVRFVLFKSLTSSPTPVQSGEFNTLAGGGSPWIHECTLKDGRTTTQDSCANQILKGRDYDPTCDASVMRCNISSGQWEDAGKDDRCAELKCFQQACDYTKLCGPVNGCAEGETCIRTDYNQTPPGTACINIPNACPTSTPVPSAVPTTSGQNNPTPTAPAGAADKCSSNWPSHQACGGVTAGDHCTGAWSAWTCRITDQERKLCSCSL